MIRKSGKPIQDTVHPSTGKQPPARDFRPPPGDRGLIYRLCYNADPRYKDTKGNPVTMQVIQQKRILFFSDYCKVRAIIHYPYMWPDGKMYWYGKITRQDTHALADFKRAVDRYYLTFEVQNIDEGRFAEIMQAAFTHQAHQFKLDDSGYVRRVS